MTVKGARTLGREVAEAFRLIVASALAMVAVLVAAVTWFIAVGEPTADRTARVVSLSQDATARLAEEQSMLRSFLVTGDDRLVATYPALRDRIENDRSDLELEVMGTESTQLVQRFSAAITTWQVTWASSALAPSTRQEFISSRGALNAGALAAFMKSGRDSFRIADSAGGQVVAHAQAAQAAGRRDTFLVAIGTAALLLLIAAGTTVSTLRRRRALLRRVVDPIGVLLSKVQAVGRGEFGVAPVIDAPQEILALRDELGEMSASLHLQQRALAVRADEAAAHALRLKLVTEFAREISSSLTLSHVLAAVASAGLRLVDSPRVRVWLLQDDLKTLRLHYDSQIGDVSVPTTKLVGDDGLSRAVLDHRLHYSAGIREDGSAAAPDSRVAGVPLVKGTRAIGVLEIALPWGVRTLDDDTVDILFTTAGHAATAIDAALLYTLAESLSRSDPLTGLANRRQLDADLGIEMERALRYERPLTFLMVDIDHFKEVNDTHGHALGDVVLREVGGMLRDHMRAGDTAYRYGGEEFAVLARETDREGGHGVAERLRQAIEDRYAGGSDLGIDVTISIGLAALSPGVRTAEDLVTSADAALYDAKRAGRNRVTVAASAGLGSSGTAIRAVG